MRRVYGCLCKVVVATYGIGHSVATATGMTITAGISVAAITVTIDYDCSQF